MHFDKPLKRNDFHKSRLRRKGGSFISKAKLPFLFAITTIFVVFAIYSSYFKLKNIEIIRSHFRTDISKIQFFLGSKYYGKNIFTLKINEIESELKDEFENWQEIKIKRKFPDSIIVNVKNFPPFAEVKTKYIKTKQSEEKKGEVENEKESETSKQGLEFLAEKEITNQEIIEQSYIINEKGSLSPAEIGIEPSFSFVYAEELDSQPLMGSELVREEDVKIIKEISDYLLEDYELISKEILYFYNAKEAHFNLFKFTLWFDLGQDIKEQLNKFRLALKEVDQANLDYVDLRIKNRIIYKERDAN